MAKTALLIGISEYQAGLNALPGSLRDVEALEQVLKEPSIGGFHEVKTLCNPDPQTMRCEIEILFAEAERNDLVLLYFSGHGIKDDVGKLFFATSSTRKSKKNQIIQSTMVPASFVHDMMNNCKAKRQGIILDCCFSGAFDPSLAVKDDNSIDLQGQLEAEGRVVLASSSHIQLSFEQKGDSRLSIYTNYLVDGLKTGDADLDEKGVISARDLHRYITHRMRERSPKMTPKLITFKDMGFDIVLAKSPVSNPRKGATPRYTVDLGNIKLPASNDKIDRREYLPNFLDPYEDLIQELTANISETSVPSRNSSAKENLHLQEITLNAIQDSSDANFVLIFKTESDGTLSVIAQSDFAETEENDKLLNFLRSTLLTTVSRGSIFNPEHHGIHKKCVVNGENLHKVFVFIPLDLETQSTFMLVAGLPESSQYLGDAYGRVISSFYHSHEKFPDNNELVEAAIIDDLKKDYKFLSLALYNWRFELFCKRLQQMTVYFEPILELDSLTISGWEALARDPKTSIAPYDLFHAAELWGVRFMIELDQHFLRVATEKYKTGRQEIKQNRTQDILPLSVNVYPESLTRSAYFRTVEKIVKEERLIPGRKLILEISEKISLPQYIDDKGPKASWLGFKTELGKYVRDLKVRFAIDDFGVEHASVSQLAGLKPPYIKIDREILFHESRDIIINFVHDLGASNTLDPPNVILEGFDEESPVALGHLKDIGVNYIQGYIINRAQPQIYRLPEKKIAELRERIAVS